MGEIVPIARDTEAPFREAAAEVYIDLLDTKPRVRMTDVVDEMRARWHEYRAQDSTLLLGRLQTREFSEYLAERRIAHLRHTVAARLVAAEMGSTLGALALEEIFTRLRTDPDSIRTRELIEIADRMVAWSDKVGAQVGEIEQAQKIEGNTFTQILMNVPPERAEAMAAEMARRAIKQGRDEN